MIKSRRANQIFILLFFLCAATVQAQEQAVNWEQKVDSKVEQLMARSGILASRTALWLQRISDNKTLYQHNHNQLFIPASVTKLFAAGAFLEHLPLQFNTQLLAASPIEERVLRGNLYLKGGGDAHFTSESMWNLVRSFARTRVQKIEGHIVVDDTLFPAQKSRLPANGRAYNAPISSMLLNWSVASIYVRGGDPLGSPAWVDIDPGPTAVRVINKAITGERTRSLAVRRLKGRAVASDTSRPLAITTSNENIASADKSICVRDSIEVSGTVSRHAKEKLVYRSITRPSCWSGFNLIDFLKLYNIQVQNKVRRDSVPMRARILAEHKSLTTPELVRKMMQFSNNTMTEMMYQHFKLAFKAPSGRARREPTQLTLDQLAPAKLAQYIRSYGVQDFQLDSVSGLSRSNKFKALDVGRYLLRMRGHPVVGVDFMSSLPVSGGQGTLEKRLTAPHAKGRVRAKTGMLSGVVGLAGFAQHPQQGELVFVYFFNGPQAQNEKAKQLIDTILEQILSI